jgi:hypothetical protein
MAAAATSWVPRRDRPDGDRVGLRASIAGTLAELAVAHPDQLIADLAAVAAALWAGQVWNVRRSLTLWIS